MFLFCLFKIVILFANSSVVLYAKTLNRKVSTPSSETFNVSEYWKL